MRLWRVGLCRSMYSYSDGQPRRAEPRRVVRAVRVEPGASPLPIARGVAAGSREAACGQSR